MPQNGQVRVGFHRITYLHIEPGEPGQQSAVIALNRGCTINVGRRAVETRNGSQIDRFAVEVLIDVSEVMHDRGEKMMSKACRWRV